MSRSLWKVSTIAMGAFLVVGLSLAVACGDDDGGDEGGGDEAENGGPAAAESLIIDANTVLGPEGQPEDAEGNVTVPICVLQSRFAPGEEVVWRVKVFDPATGEAMDDTALDSVDVELPDGQVFEAEYGDHPRDNPTDFFWTTSWEVPADYPTGSVPYSIVATASDGRVGEYSEFNVAPSLLTIAVD